MNNLIYKLKKQDRYILSSTTISIISILTIINLFAIYYPRLPHQIPLFYSREWGDPQMGTLSQFSIMPFIILLSLLVNLLFIWQLHHSQLVLKRILGITTAIVSIILCISAFQIVGIFI